MSGDIIDLAKHREMIREAAEKKEKEADSESLVNCPDCGDGLFWMIRVKDDPDDTLAVICQHCNEPVGYAFEFPPDDESE